MTEAVATASLDRGFAATGEIIARQRQSVQLIGQDTTGWASVLWEIRNYPETFGAPNGWTLNATTGAYESTDIRPVAFLLVESDFGKWDIDLTVNGALVDRSLRISVRSQVLSLDDAGFPEATDRSGFRGIARDINRNWRKIDAAFSRISQPGSGAADYQTVQAETATPGWYVVGSFKSPSSKPGKLRLIGCVSAATLTMRGRLFDLSSSPPAPVGSMVTIAATLTATLADSTAFAILSGHKYQLQVEVTGANTTADFGAVHFMQAVDASAP